MHTHTHTHTHTNIHTQIAQMFRFWHNGWNIFDVVVIYASIAMAVTQFVMSRQVSFAAL